MPDRTFMNKTGGHAAVVIIKKYPVYNEDVRTQEGINIICQYFLAAKHRTQNALFQKSIDKGRDIQGRAIECPGGIGLL